MIPTQKESPDSAATEPGQIDRNPTTKKGTTVDSTLTPTEEALFNKFTKPDWAVPSRPGDLGINRAGQWALGWETPYNNVAASEEGSMTSTCIYRTDHLDDEEERVTEGKPYIQPWIGGNGTEPIHSAEEARGLAFALLLAADQLDVINGELVIPVPSQPTYDDEDGPEEYLEAEVDEEGGICVSSGCTSQPPFWTWGVDVDKWTLDSLLEAQEFIVLIARAGALVDHWRTIPREEAERITGMVKKEVSA